MILFYSFGVIVHSQFATWLIIFFLPQAKDYQSHFQSQSVYDTGKR